MRVIVFKMEPAGAVFLANVDTGDAMMIVSKSMTSTSSIYLNGNTWPRVNNHASELRDLRDCYQRVQAGQCIELKDELRKTKLDVFILAKFEIPENPLTPTLDEVVEGEKS